MKNEKNNISFFLGAMVRIKGKNPCKGINTVPGTQEKLSKI